MANQSIFAAFERMWQHVVLAINNKKDIYAQNDEPVDAPDGALWIDLNAVQVPIDETIVIPTVTTSDNGKFMRVVNGEWDVSDGVVLYTEQDLTEEQKQQAIINIGVDDYIKETCSSIVDVSTGDPAILTNSADLRLYGLKIYGKTTQDGTPTPELPLPLESLGSNGSIKVTVFGKNLFDVQNATVNSSLANAVNYKTETGIRFTGTQNGNTNVWVLLKEPIFLRAGTPVSLSYECAEISTYFPAIYIQYKNTLSSSALDKAAGNNVVFEQDVYITGLHLWRRDEGLTYDVTIDNLQLELGSMATDYELYKEAQTLSVSTPNGLPGIPVTSGGNYTDENGQEWVCDEVDFLRGVYTQRLRTLIFDGSDDEDWIVNGPTGAGLYRVWNRQFESIIKPTPTVEIAANALCSSFPIYTAGNTWWQTNDEFAIDHNGSIWVIRAEFTNPDTLIADWKNYLKETPMTILTELAVPLESPMPDEGMESFATMHTNYPNTTILNDAGAFLEVSYVVDNELYIDNKIAEIQPIFVPQELTDEQKAQARSNIGAATVEDILAALPTWEGGSY